MATITDKVNDILTKRKSKLPQIREKINALVKTKEKVCAFERLKNTIVGDDGQLVPNGKFYNVLADKPEMVINISQLFCSSLKDKLTALIESYKELEERFSREYINIAVVGPARQGKSRFLQSVTGLDDRCIPAFVGSHCTGASSSIENGSEEKVCVELTYKSNNEMIAEIQGYINTVTNGNECIVSLSELPGISKEKLNEWLEKYISAAEDIKAKEAKDILYKRYILHYNEWKDLVGHEPELKYDEDEIMTYVSQHNGRSGADYEAFYKFVAVKSAKIVKKFVHDDCGKIRLIDTVGLGSLENNTESNMMNVIKHESDGVIFFKRPEASVAGYNEENDSRIYAKIKKEFYGRKMDKWFSYILNHTKEGEAFKDNSAMCELQKNQVTEDLPLLSLNILDVSDADSVKNDFLIPYLTSLSNNVDEIDSIIVNEVNALAITVYDDYKAFFNKVERVISGKMKNNNSWLAVFKQAFAETYARDMTGAVKGYMNEWREKKSLPCDVLKNQINDICDGISSRIPSVEEISDIIANNPTKTPHEIWMNQLNKLRTDLTASFIDIDYSLAELVSEFKERIVDIMTGDDGGRLKYITEVNPDKPKAEWLADFSNDALDGEIYTEIKRAVDFLHNFDVSVRGFMMHKVRIQLDIINPLIPQAAVADLDEGSGLAKSINFHLKIRMKNVKDNLNQALKALCIVPNEAFYAAIGEFFDRVTFSDAVKDEWETLYSEYAGRVWKDRFDAIAYQAIAFTEWKDMVSELGEKAQKTNFVLNIA